MATKKSPHTDEAFEMIPAADAPPIPKKIGRDANAARKEMFDNRVKAIADTGNVGKITIAENETARSIKSALSHAAGRTGHDVNRWSDDNHVYFTSTYTGVIRERKPHTKS